ncbi:MAG TPA: hypothetical protein VEJ63_08495 [Planctomycetota bacterium]|nr:hypothetical protein [Planctomycetota bacterium]
MRPLAAIALALVLCATASMAEEYQIPWTTLRDVAQRYLDACVEPKELKSMEKKLRQRVEQRMQDNDTLGEDVVMRSMMLDWAAGNQRRIERKEKDAVRQACYYFVVFYDKGYNIPAVISDQLSPENVKEINAYLEEQIAAAKGGAKSEKTEKPQKPEKEKKK